MKISTDRIRFTFRVLCGAGVLIQGSSDDFLACVQIAREKKVEWTPKLVGSVLRVQIFYPNRKRVPSADLVAAYAALDASAPQTEFGCPRRPSIGQLVLIRRAAAAQISPARSEARTAEFCVADGRWGASVVDVDFSQAGVVAPPDSPDLGNVTLTPPICLGA